MLRFLQVLAVLLVAVTMALSLAHALEFPGKMRLGRETYLAVQQIYYPGFTIGGMAEPASILAILALLLLGPRSGTVFWATLAALVALVATHAIYWLVTHPVNSAWTRDLQLSGAGATFFGLLSSSAAGDWAHLRDVWEYSHIARALFATLGLALLTVALTA